MIDVMPVLQETGVSHWKSLAFLGSAHLQDPHTHRNSETKLVPVVHLQIPEDLPRQKSQEEVHAASKDFELISTFQIRDHHDKLTR
jgi:hypothetical protein